MARCKFLALLLTAGCAAPTRRACELEPPEVIARSSGLMFDGVAASGTPVQYAWSDHEGLFVRASRVQRLGERCRGGIAALARTEALWVACSRPADDGGSVDVYRVHEQDVRHWLVGKAGRDGHGIALAASEHDLYVAYHEGAIGDHAIWLARVGAAQRRISHVGSAAREPSLVAHDRHVYAAFAELTLRADGAPASALYVSREDGDAQRIVETQAFSPTPRLTADAQGLVLGYRDRSPGPQKKDRSELRVMRLDARGRIAGPAITVGRANDVGEPNLYGCGELVAALLPREYGGERYVGIHPMDEKLSALSSGHQLYESGHDFVLAAGACDTSGLWLFAADRAAPSKPGVQAIALRFRCDQ